MIETVAVFGATGGTGAHLVAAARQRGWGVRALCRPGRRLGSRDSEIVALYGELTDPAALAETVSGCQAACCVFGPRPPHTDVFCAAATHAIIQALARAGITRLISQTGAMIGPYPQNRTLPFELMAKLFARQRPAAAADRWQQEVAVRESGLEWTVIKPPRLTDGPASPRVRAGPDLRVGLTSKIGRADLANLIVSELVEARFRRETVFVAG